MKLKKILFVLRKINYYGASSNSLDLIINLNNNKYQKKLIIEDLEIHDFNSNYYYKEMIKQSISIVFLNKFFPVFNTFSLKLYYFIRKFKFINHMSLKYFNFIIKKFTPDFIYFNYIADLDKYNLSIYKEIPIIIHIHLQLNKLKNLNNNQKVTLEKAYKIITYNSEAINILSKFLPKSKFVNFELSLNFSKLNFLKQIQNKKINNIINQLKEIKNNNNLIVCNFANFTLRKGGDIFKNIARELDKKNNSNIFFVWIGLNKDQDKILKNNEKYKNLIFFEKVNNIFPILEYIDVLMINSRDEGGPTILLEGMYFNKLCLTHINCGFSERIIENNKNGICVNKNETNEYIYYLNHIASNYKMYDDIKSNGHNKIYNQFDILKKIDLIEEILN